MLSIDPVQKTFIFHNSCLKINRKQVHNCLIIACKIVYNSSLIISCKVLHNLCLKITQKRWIINPVRFPDSQCKWMGEPDYYRPKNIQKMEFHRSQIIIKTLHRYTCTNELFYIAFRICILCLSPCAESRQNICSPHIKLTRFGKLCGINLTATSERVYCSQGF